MLMADSCLRERSLGGAREAIAVKEEAGSEGPLLMPPLFRGAAGTRCSVAVGGATAAVVLCCFFSHIPEVGAV